MDQHQSLHHKKSCRSQINKYNKEFAVHKRDLISIDGVEKVSGRGLTTLTNTLTLAICYSLQSSES